MNQERQTVRSAVRTLRNSGIILPDAEAKALDHVVKRVLSRGRKLKALKTGTPVAATPAPAPRMTVKCAIRTLRAETPKGRCKALDHVIKRCVERGRKVKHVVLTARNWSDEAELLRDKIDRINAIAVGG